MNSELKLNSVPAAKKRKRGASLDNRKARAGWMFVMPFVLSFIIIYLPIIIDSIKYSFNKIKIGQGGGYTRIYLLGERRGDGAEEAIIELV